MNINSGFYGEKGEDFKISQVFSTLDDLISNFEDPNYVGVGYGEYAIVANVTFADGETSDDSNNGKIYQRVPMGSGTNSVNGYKYIATISPKEVTVNTMFADELVFKRDNGVLKFKDKATSVNNITDIFVPQHFYTHSSSANAYSKAATAALHNSIYRGENLFDDKHFGDPFEEDANGKTGLDRLVAAIKKGDWTDIFVGDYLELECETQSITKKIDDVAFYCATDVIDDSDIENITYRVKIRWIVMEIDPYYCGSVASPDGSSYLKSVSSDLTADSDPSYYVSFQGINVHHIALVPLNAVNYTNYNNSQSTNANTIHAAKAVTEHFTLSQGYDGCVLHRLLNNSYNNINDLTNTLPDSTKAGSNFFYRRLMNSLGVTFPTGEDSKTEKYILTHNEILSRSLTSSIITSAKFRLLNEIDVFGTNIYAKDGEHGVGLHSHQLAGFRLNPSLISKKTATGNGYNGWWLSSLRDITAGSQKMCCVSPAGRPSYTSVESRLSIVPMALLGDPTSLTTLDLKTKYQMTSENPNY